MCCGGSKTHYYDDLRGFCVGPDISKLKMFKKLFKIVPARVWTPGSVAGVTGLTQPVREFRVDQNKTSGSACEVLEHI